MPDKKVSCTTPPPHSDGDMLNPSFVPPGFLPSLQLTCYYQRHKETLVKTKFPSPHDNDILITKFWHLFSHLLTVTRTSDIKNDLQIRRLYAPPPAIKVCPRAVRAAIFLRGGTGRVCAATHFSHTKNVYINPNLPGCFRFVKRRGWGDVSDHPHLRYYTSGLIL